MAPRNMHSFDMTQPYVVIAGSSATNLQALVVEQMEKGYTPIGGITTRHGYNTKTCFFQALIKTELLKT